MWNVMSEEIDFSKSDKHFTAKPETSARPMKVKDVDILSTPRIPTGSSEIDRLFGGGVVPGSLTLVGGDPGIGKSTLMLQLASSFPKRG